MKSGSPFSSVKGAFLGAGFLGWAFLGLVVGVAGFLGGAFFVSSLSAARLALVHAGLPFCQKKEYFLNLSTIFLTAMKLCKLRKAHFSPPPVGEDS